MLRPSRRTDPAVTEMIRTASSAQRRRVWNFAGENPYFGMLALADLIRRDAGQRVDDLRGGGDDGAGMVAKLPGLWQRQGLFLKPLMDARSYPSVRMADFRHMAGVAIERYTACRGRDVPPAGTLRYYRWPNVAGEPVIGRTPI